LQLTALLRVETESAALSGTVKMSMAMDASTMAAAWGRITGLALRTPGWLCQHRL
jgi:hypothetical protein